MKKFNITKREMTFFFLGLLTMFLIVLIYEWNDFKEGFSGGLNGTKTEVKK